MVRSSCGSLLLQMTPRGLCITSVILGWPTGRRDLPRTVTLSAAGSIFLAERGGLAVHVDLAGGDQDLAARVSTRPRSAMNF